MEGTELVNHKNHRISELDVNMASLDPALEVALSYAVLYAGVES